MSYRLIGSSIIDNNCGCENLPQLIDHVQSIFGDMPFEYWSEDESGEYHF
jgi:hypothetical protein